MSKNRREGHRLWKEKMEDFRIETEILIKLSGQRKI